MVDNPLPWCKRAIDRTTEIFISKYGLLRNVNVKTSTTVLKRTVSKPCLILNFDE